MMQALAELDSYGLFTAEAVQNPYPYYKAMREREPVHWSERAQAWYFTRYRDVYELQDRPDLSVDRIETLYSYLPRTNPERFSDIVEHYHRWLLYRDDAYHDRLKALFLKAMTPRAVERLRPMLQRRVDVMLDELEKRDAFDAYLDFAARLPTQVMLDLLGLPDSDEVTDAALERSLFQFSVPAGFARQGGDGAGATRNSRRPAGLFHAADRGASAQSRRGHDLGHGAGRRPAASGSPTSKYWRPAT